ncbi:glycerophosphodiester phosphodiesterase GDPD4 isoform X1 [Chlorella sorokiniana]|uniref:glycerophosphodiester phosphodiesterase n=1 Tax=Chlorella sorokiniana TaxID=3076 RepID=A0A2P6TI02_CHLSO|nr:glycerophosphodiester phosphodiesterase GDPD4 isoform X1 [Chlorella sorokiniana]|eukprot:PRW33921.1 glycerophosphodiester phosphodiesterase GDPD4 isoform X1 [Chlorella sorokiniana]
MPPSRSRRRSPPPSDPRPGQQGKAQKKSRNLRKNIPAVIIAAVIATLLDRAVMYLRTPAPAPGLPWPGAASDPLHAQELHALHHQPSEDFCAAEPPLVCAHGGDSSDGAPRNTLEAFQAALQQGVPCLEVDVARTSDGRLVVLHPRDLAQLLGGSSAAGGAAGGAAADGGSSGADNEQQQPLPQVGDYSWEDLAALRWQGGERVASVEDVLRLAVSAAQHITLDARTHTSKGGEDDSKALAAQLVDLVAQTGCSQCLVWAKSDALVKQVKELSPDQPVGYIVMNETAAAREAGMHRLLRLPRAEVAALHHSMASGEVMQKLHAAGQRVHAWTANTAGMMRAVLDAGVYAVVTDHPRHLLAALEARLHICRSRKEAAAAEAAAAAAAAADADVPVVTEL